MSFVAGINPWTVELNYTNCFKPFGMNTPMNLSTPQPNSNARVKNTTAANCSAGTGGFNAIIFPDLINAFGPSVADAVANLNNNMAFFDSECKIYNFDIAFIVYSFRRWKVKY